MDNETGAPSDTQETNNGDVEMNNTNEGAASTTEADPNKNSVKLEELFEDFDSDDDFPSSAPVKDASSPAALTEGMYVAASF
jgi:DNA primase small subunit